MKNQNFIKKAVFILSNPKRFFDQAKKEKGFGKAFFYYMTFAALSLIINFIVLSSSFISGIDAPPYMLLIIVTALLIMILAAVSASSFLVYGIYHLIIKLLKGRNNYIETYKLIYAATPLLIAQLIPFYSYLKVAYYILVVFAAAYSIYLEYIGLRKLQNMDKRKAVTAIVIIRAISLISLLVLNYVFMQYYNI